MHAGGPRRNGGLGFATNGPSITVAVSPSADLEITDGRAKPSAAIELKALKDHLRTTLQQLKLDGGAKIEIDGDMRTHQGLGSGTAIRLACIEGLALLSGRMISRAEIVALSHRGGTSGIGVNTYFDGGFVLDSGVQNQENEFVPSSYAQGPKKPLSLVQLSMPDWPMLLCIPNKCRPKTQEEELEFFRRTAPLSASSSYEAAYYATFGLASAILETDYDAFCAALNKMQNVEWKRAEREEHGVELRVVDEALRRSGADCVALSSLGPLVMVLASPDRKSVV